MAEKSYKYVIVGAGLAGASAVEGIRERDKNGTILLVGSERHLPYDRPPLTKKLWFGKKKVADIFVHDNAFYDKNGVEVLIGTTISSLDATKKTLADTAGNTYVYEKLLIATGGAPRTLDIPGGDLKGVCYYRYLDDYLATREKALEGSSAVVVGGGFIGSEIAAALTTVKVDVTLIFPGRYVCDRVFPEPLGKQIVSLFQERGIKVIAPDKPTSFKREGDKFLTATERVQRISSDIVIVGVGIKPEMDLAQRAGLVAGDGIVVNEFLQTSNPDVYAAGDNAFFPYKTLGRSMRVEHWDNAINQGKYAGRNMAGAREPYDYEPYFFSDLFEFGYEAVGDVSSKLETFADWKKENDTGVIYYLKEGKVRGAMMCNVWDKVPAAREIIRKGAAMGAEALHGAIA
jgi:3-phenylpropionate/trans-cinnamate dioxygenase ferredoxin reductase component